MQSRTTTLASTTARRVLRAAIALVVLASPQALAQVAASVRPSVRLQPSTPGIQQTGHANIDGTLRAGSLYTDAFRLGASATLGHVLTTDALGIGTWQPIGLAGGLVLPYSGSAAAAGPVFAIENTGSGSAVHGEGSGQTGDLGGPLAGVYGLGGTGVLGSGSLYGVRGESGGGGLAVYGVHSSGNLGLLADSLYGAYGESLDPAGVGVRGVSDNTTGIAYGVHGSSNSMSPAAAGVHAEGFGTAGPGVPNAAALLVNDGAITVAGPLINRASGSILVAGPWAPIFSCTAAGHFHVIGYTADVPLMNNLILPGPPNVGSMISATVETDPGPPPAQTSYYVQVYGKMPGSCTFRVTRMGTPAPPACPPPAEINYVHYTIINPL